MFMRRVELSTLAEDRAENLLDATGQRD